MGAFTGKTVLILGGSRGIGAAMTSFRHRWGQCTIHLCGVERCRDAWHKRLER